MTLAVGLVEGVEDGLAVRLSGWAPVWAATWAGAIAKFPVIGGVEQLTIFADRDDAGLDGGGRCPSQMAARRTSGGGRSANGGGGLGRGSPRRGERPPGCGPEMEAQP